jgi:hypothetical protein
VPEYQNLTEAAEGNPAIREILLSRAGHLQASYNIGERAGYETTESSVRRWRNTNLAELLRVHSGVVGPADSVEAEDLSEDIGDGTDLDDNTELHPGWDGFKDSDRTTLHAKLDETLSAVNANPENVAGLRVSQYQMLTKDLDGRAHKHDLYSVKLLVKTKELAPAWPVVQPAAPVTIAPVNVTGRVRRQEKVTVVLPDPQIGYRHFIDDGSFDPFHDEKALDVALQIVAQVQPDEVLCLGDFMDFPAFGRYEQEAAFAATTQMGIDYGHQFLARIRALIPNGKITVLEGNHDRRLQNMVVNNAKAAFGLKQALDTTGWPVLSVPYLCNFTDLEVDYVMGYPAGEHWINDNLRAIHGTKVRSSGSTASAVVHDDDVSTLFGHIHRVETQYLTRSNRSGGRTLVAHTPGCLCRIDGAVPSVKGSTDLNGRPVESYENWQQGLTIVDYEEGDGGFALESLFINTFRGHKVRYAGQVYTPNI